MLVTGARGFIGRSTVAAALRRGHAVRALVRPATDVTGLAWSAQPNVEVVRGDLQTREGLEQGVAAVDVVIHLAAAMSGDQRTQLALAVDGTAHLLEAMAAAGVRRIVAVSSIAVYDFALRRPFALLDESSPLESHPERRDAYCRSKLQQEETVRRVAASRDLHWLIFRPGVVYGPGRLWTPRLGLALSSRWWLLTGTRAPLPLTYVENCADALVLGAERDDINAATINVVDDETPTQLAYARRIRRQLEPPPRLLPVPWTLLRPAAAVARIIRAVAAPGRGAPTGLLSPRQLAARCKPRRYSNARLKDLLGWKPRWSFEAALGAIGGHAPGQAPGVHLTQGAGGGRHDG